MFSLRDFAFRAIMVAGVVGVGLTYNGFNEYRLLKKSSAIPVSMELSELEKIDLDKIENYYVKIGPHLMSSCGGLYVYKKHTTKIDYFYYPIFSFDGAFYKEFYELFEKYGTDIPPDKYPDLSFRVLVRTSEYKTVKEIQDLYDFSICEDSIKGMITNNAGGCLDDEEKKLISDYNPKINVDDLIIFDKDHKPMFAIEAIIMIGGGIICLIFSGVGGILYYRSSKKSDISTSDSQE